MIWKTNDRKQTLSLLEEFVYMAEKGTPLRDDFGPFPQGRLGDLLNRLVDSFKRSEDTKESISIEREKVVKASQDNIAQKKQLTQNISHELKTPVSCISGYLETIINNPNIPKEQQMLFVRKSYDQTRRLSELLSDLSVITRMDEGSEMIERENISLSEIVQGVVSDLRARVSGTNYKIVDNLPEGLEMCGNHSLVQSIFYNLIENAMLYSKGTKVEISLVGERDGKYEIEVVDDGVGMEEKHLSRIFERFYRVDKGRSREIGGTGLGLSIVKNAVVLHGGVITASQVQPTGLRFLFTLAK